MELSDARKAELVKQMEEKAAAAAALKAKEKPKPEIKKKEQKPKAPTNKVYSLAAGTLGAEKIVQESFSDEENEEETKKKKTKESEKNKKKKKTKKLISKLKAKDKKQTKKKKKTPKVQEVIPKNKSVPTSQPVIIDEARLNEPKVIAERRTWRALQLALCICRLGQCVTIRNIFITQVMLLS